MGGAIPGKDFLALLEQTGFENVEFIEETGFNSSAKTRGALFYAIKPRRSIPAKDSIERNNAATGKILPPKAAIEKRSADIED